MQHRMPYDYVVEGDECKLIFMAYSWTASDLYLYIQLKNGRC